ncbi:hypothetical protein [Streptomyces afghaniensis]|uniref:hypothetical protein n=1 Tax=Streptomyces afghaniensis TaxID=66865 RepID=UPI002781208C|nr:hypothetical protein [Streptomyces afghaniensis]MDQ1015690.1 hypothetical protein [Streptomyces afghaniensis]
MAGESTLAEWAGKSATVFKEEFSGVPKNLKKLEKSYGMCGDALADFWPKLSSADSWVTRASKEADKYEDDPTGSKSDADKPDEATVRAATRDAQHARRHLLQFDSGHPPAAAAEAPSPAASGAAPTGCPPPSGGHGRLCP